MFAQEDVARTPAKEKMVHLRNLVIWLPLVPIVLSILFCSGQVSVLGMQSHSAEGVQSKLEADYSHWNYEVVAPMDHWR